MNMNKFSPKEKLAVGRLIVREKAPYVTAALLGLVPIEMKGLGTVGVTQNGLLLWDPDAVAQWSVEEVAAALFHEVWHVLRDHHERGKAIGAEHRLFNVAGDAEINDDLRAGGWKLPMGDKIIYPETIGAEEGLTAEEYYRHLRDNEGSGDGHGECPGHGWCGSGAGHALPDEPQGDGNGGGEGESQAPGRTQQEMDRMRREVARAIQHEASKSRGTVPAGLQRWADATLTPPKIRWQDKLARFVRSAVSWRAGAVDYKYERPSRRQYGIGSGIGKPILPCMRQPVPQVMVAVDTSGSMGNDELTDALRETKGILDHTGAAVTFTACDAAIHELKPVRCWQDAAKLLTGGGGTSFVPVFTDALPLAKPRPEILVFITDGMGDAPAAPPRGVKVIWVLVGPYARKPYSYSDNGSGEISWGDFIFLDSENREDEDEY
jgi:predicted metal-dependent peptidase